MRFRLTKSVGALLAATALVACGNLNIRDGEDVGYSTCEDILGRFHFTAMVPPWKYNKEYRCNAWTGRSCTGGWTATGRFVYVVADAPFVNYDSEIITSLEVEELSGDPCLLAGDLITAESIGALGGTSQFYGGEDYPRALDLGEETLAGCEVLWRQEREFEGSTFNWYRRNVYFRRAGGGVLHLKFFSIDTLDKPEFGLLLRSFREGPAPDGVSTEICRCRDEHDPAGPSDC